ncbi:uncharacterized protein FFFS_11830 [Fusarium fujikuroi]|nr:uncharacterized protein FFFS_11830 [Fusarium fujikuroi]
MWLITFK